MSSVRLNVAIALAFVGIASCVGCGGGVSQQANVPTKAATGPPPPPPPPAESSAVPAAVTATPTSGDDGTVELQSGEFYVKALDGFAQKDKLLYHEKLRTSIQFAFSPAASYASTSAEFTPQALTQQGMKLISKEDVKIDGAPALLINVERMSKPQHAWILVFGSGRGVAQVTMIYPSNTENSVKTSLRNSMLTIRHRAPQ